jgi:tetratricopeptide (TPR) repeat protein
LIGCPPERAWDELAAGLVRGQEAIEMTSHASTCERCADLLRESIHIFQSDASQHKAVPNLIAKRRGVFQSRWIAAAAALVLAAGGALIYSRFQRDPLSQLSRLYAQNRALEMRIPGAEHGPLRTQRGAEAAPQVPESLLLMGDRIRNQLSRSPHHPLWLHAEGRLALIEWHPQEAIQALEAACDWGRVTPALLTDLGTAYYESGKLSKSTLDLNRALDTYGRALQFDPNQAAALFNRALIEEELNQIGPAIADLERLLVIEPSGPWSEESRSVLDRIEKKRVLLFEHRHDAGEQNVDEVRLDAILRAFTVKPESTAFAQKFRADHGDPWLTELLASVGAFEQQVGVLSDMSVIRLTAEHGRYTLEKDHFKSISKSLLPPPIAMWRDFEDLYRATHARGEFHCPVSPVLLLRRLVERHYFWLEVQALREFGYCAFQRGDITDASRYAQESIAQAQAHVLPVSEVRSAALAAHCDLRFGRIRAAAQRATDALAQITANRLPAARMHEFFNILLIASQLTESWHAARAAAHAMTETAHAVGFRDVEFANTISWAQLAMRCGDPSQAADLYRQALNYYATLAPNNDRAWAEIGFAELTGDESRLSRVERDLETVPDAILWVPYQRVRARLAMNEGRFAEAHARLDKIKTWMQGREPQPGYRWQGEFRKAAEVLFDLLAREGRLQDSFDTLQQWRLAEESTRTHLRRPAHVADQWAIVFAFAPVGKRLATWRRSGSSIEFRWAIHDRNEIERLARCYRRLLESPDSSLDEIAYFGNRLKAALFGGWMESMSTAQPILIQAEGELANIAFSALPGMAGRPIALTPFAIQEHPLPNTVSALRTALLIDGSSVRPAWAPDLPPLPSAQREIIEIRNLMPGSSEIVEGGDVSPVELASKLEKVQLLHFAGHALSTADGVSLALTRDGILDLSGMNEPLPPTIVLSACSTGRNTAREVDTGRPDSLATAFLLKGSAEVIASLWDVDSQSSEAMMKSFYSHLRSEGDTGDALQLAANELRRSAAFAHPYYWAAFTRFIRQ